MEIATRRADGLPHAIPSAGGREMGTTTAWLMYAAVAWVVYLLWQVFTLHAPGPQVGFFTTCSGLPSPC